VCVCVCALSSSNCIYCVCFVLCILATALRLKLIYFAKARHTHTCIAIHVCVYVCMYMCIQLAIGKVKVLDDASRCDVVTVAVAATSTFGAHLCAFWLECPRFWLAANSTRCVCVSVYVCVCLLVCVGVVCVVGMRLKRYLKDTKYFMHECAK